MAHIPNAARLLRFAREDEIVRLLRSTFV